MKATSKDHLKIVVLLDKTTFIAWCRLEHILATADAFERRVKLTPQDRASQINQMRVRLSIVERLRSEQHAAAFQDVLASGCLWLALRHYRGGAQILAGIDALAKNEQVVLTISIADADGAHPGTTWGFLVGTTIHDVRDKLRAQPPSLVTIETCDSN